MNCSKPNRSTRPTKRSSAWAAAAPSPPDSPMTRMVSLMHATTQSKSLTKTALAIESRPRSAAEHESPLVMVPPPLGPLSSRVVSTMFRASTGTPSRRAALPSRSWSGIVAESSPPATNLQLPMCSTAASRQKICFVVAASAPITSMASYISLYSARSSMVSMERQVDWLR